MAFGIIKADTLTHSTSGSVPTNFVKTGSSKAWMRWDMSAAVMEGNFNVSSFTEVSTGKSRFDYTSNLSDGNYAIAGIGGEKTGGGNRGLGVNGNTSVPTTSTIFYVSYNSSFQASNIDLCAATVTGDLA
tara:strand:- start:40 stop:429 length:390 start_codon:yes stop_codon:yes gene_type:complete